MLKRNKYFMTDLLNMVQEYMKSYNCSFLSSISDLDFPITHQEVKDLAKIANISVSDEEAQKYGRSEKEVISFERAEQADYDSVYG